MNRYFGWYERKIQDIKPWIEKMEKEYPWQRLMLTEYGADANIEHQTEILGDALNWTSPFYPETFQTKTHEYQWSIIAQHPYIIASYLWNMFDFAADARDQGGEPGMNHKGLVTFDRKTRKDSFYLYKAWWSDENFVHICSKRFTDRTESEMEVKVYSNQKSVALYVNGEKAGEQTGEHVFSFRVPLTGEIEVRAVAGDCTDTASFRHVDTPESQLQDWVKTKSKSANWV